MTLYYVQCVLWSTVIYIYIECGLLSSALQYVGDLYPEPYSGQVRLEGGEFPSSGRLEVYFSGQWGAVSGEGTLDANLSTTVCRQLGFSSGTGQVVR